MFSIYLSMVYLQGEEEGGRYLKPCGEIPAVCTEVIAVGIELFHKQIMATNGAERNLVNSNIIVI